MIEKVKLQTWHNLAKLFLHVNVKIIVTMKLRAPVYCHAVPYYFSLDECNSDVSLPRFKM